MDTFSSCRNDDENYSGQHFNRFGSIQKDLTQHKFPVAETRPGSGSQPSRLRANDASSSSSSSSTSNQQPRGSMQVDREAIFPCLHPANPHMNSLKNRIQSFLQNMSTWVNSSQLKASIKELAAAGLYYIGKYCWLDGALTVSC